MNWDHPLENTERPADLVVTGEFFTDEVALTNSEMSINRFAAESAREMFLHAASFGHRYKIASAYRSVSYQEQLFAEALAENPDYAEDPFSNPVRVVPAAMSEHATGLALDIVLEDDWNRDFEGTPEALWLEENAHLYGFILRYPKGKEHITGVIFEPWHFRFVGKDAAAYIYENNLTLEEFYDSMKEIAEK
ncbi:MAG: M15 family metallopeptidase [Christensenellaceae bacterium]|nr:M15 family metallopeptidase [Christensenellaceae bacterium]